MVALKLKIGLVTEPLASKPLHEVMDWVISEVPEISGLEIGTGAYAPTSHCDMPRLLREPGGRRAWKDEIEARGLEIAAFNCWGNPLHPDGSIARAHDAALRDTILVHPTLLEGLIPLFSSMPSQPRYPKSALAAQGAPSAH